MTTLLRPFGDFLQESLPSDTLVFAYGRFQPPTVGHEKLVSVVKSTARLHRATPQVFVSRSHDAAKNPLSVEERLFFLDRMFPAVQFAAVQDTPKVAGIMSVLTSFAGQYTKVIVVCGSDRLEEFKKKVTAQNGKLFSYDSIEFVSAGERDPDSDDIDGMSGTKMRAAAHSMDFDRFREGIPKSLSDFDTRNLMMAIRKSMSVRESFKLPTPTVTGTAQKKAVFLIGVPGSGKDFVLAKTLSQHSLVEVTSLPAAEKLSQGIPFVVNTNAEDIGIVKAWKTIFEEYGNYETKCIFVSVSDSTSKKRNIERAARGGRVTPEASRKSKWDAGMANRDKYRTLFGEANYIEFDNSMDLRVAADVTRKRKAAELLNIFNEVRVFMGGIVSQDINVLFEQELLYDIGTKKNKVIVVKKKRHGSEQQEKSNT